MAEQRYYSAEDFNKVKKVDAHVHYNSLSEVLTNLADEHNFRLLSINTKIPGFPSIPEQQDCIVNHPAFRKTLFYLGTFDAANVFAGESEAQLKYLHDSIHKGASGFKVWKDIGMVVQNANGGFIFIDDAAFKPFFDYAEKNDLPVLGHIGEPRNCWLPVEEMTVNNDKNYFRLHPEYHMYLHPECPSYEHLIHSYEHMLEQHPRLTYIGAHFGSLEWSVEEVAKRVDRFPGMAVDTAERMTHMQYQTVHNREEVREFFIKYQDRIIYGTDIIVDDAADLDVLRKRAVEIWRNDWRYLTTDDEMTSPFVDDIFRGLKLPADVVDKIYYGNAVRWYKLPLLRTYQDAH